MYLRGKKWLAFAATAAALAACGPGDMTSDTGMGDGGGNDSAVTDGGGNDGGGNDGAVTDGGGNDGAVTDGGGDGGGGGGLCTAANIIDLATAGTTTGGVLHYVGNNSNASATPEIAGPSCGVDPSAYPYQVAHRYHTTGAAYVRVSTDNPGTPASSDTIVWIQSDCTTTSPTELACSDDINYPDNVHSLATTTDLVPAGTDVFIFIANFGTTQSPATPGAYELTVQEVQPIPAGGACDPTGPELCAMGNSCAADASGTTGTCAANGTLGAACLDASAAMRCNAGLVCRVSNGRESCFTEIAAGGTCDPSTPPDRCADNYSCVGTGTSGTCNANGTLGAQCRPSTASARCDTGLECRADFNGVEFCVMPIAAGAECTVGQDPDPCATGTVCAGDFQVGHCVAPGSIPNAPCRDDGSCDTGLACTQVSFFSSVCLRTRTIGQTCNFFEDTCGDTALCEPSSQTDTRNGTCIAVGATGGYCDDMNACAAGNTCIMAAGATSGICRSNTLIAAGAACDPSGRTNACVADYTCVPETTGTAFTCQANGSAAGTACTSTGTCTNVLLSCSATTGGYCQGTVAATCVPRYNSSACAAGNVCIATSLNAGNCGIPTAEGAGANDTATTGQAVTLTGGMVAVQGALTPAGDVDCYTFTAAAGNSLYAEVNNGRAGCSADESTVILLYDAMGRLIDGNFATGQNDPCPILDGTTTTTSPSSNLAAGSYTLCVQGTDSSATTASYVLDIHLQ